MNRLYKYASGLALAGLFSMALITPANAQRGARGGGGMHVSGGFGGFRGGGAHIGIAYRGGFGLGYHGGFYGGRYFYGYPSIGFGLSVLPFGYYPFYYGPNLYYYYGGVFYAPTDGGGYEVTVPPVGAAVPSLPKGAQPIKIDGQQFYEFNGVYYKKDVDDQNKTVYVVAGKDGVLNTGSDAGDDSQPAPQVGDITNQLPEGSRKVTLNNKKYYVAPDGIYYEEFRDTHNFKAYRIVSIPADDNGVDQDQHQQ